MWPKRLRNRQKTDPKTNQIKEKEKIPQEIIDLVNKREYARQIKDFKEADKLRHEINKKGYLVEDTPQGPRIKKK